MDTWECCDLGEVQEFLRIRIKRKGNKIYLDQAVYLEKVLEHFGMQNAKASKVPLIEGYNPSENMQEDLASMGHPPSDDDMYAIALGSLPPSYDSYISAVSTMSSVLGTTISADSLMTTIMDKYDHRLLNSKGAKKEDNVAFHSHEGVRGHNFRPPSLEYSRITTPNIFRQCGTPYVPPHRQRSHNPSPEYSRTPTPSLSPS